MDGPVVDVLHVRTGSHSARTADRKRTVTSLAMISLGRIRVMNKQKKTKKNKKKPVVTQQD